MPDPDPTPTPDPKPTPAPTPTPDPKPWTPPESQADLDRIINQATAKVHSKYVDYNDLKTKATEHDKTLEASKTQAQKDVDAARKDGEKVANERANARLVGAEVRAQAAVVKFRDPADAIAQLRADGKLDGIKVSDDGEPDAAAIKALLEDLAKAKPYLVGEDPPKPPPSFGGGPRKTSDKTETAPGYARMRQAYADTTK